MARLVTFAVCLCLSACLPLNMPPTIEGRSEQLRLIDQGTLQLRMGELDQARASFLVANEISASAAAYDGLGCVAFLEGDMAEAERYFIKAYKLDPDYSGVLANLALLYDRQGFKAEALKLYELSLKEDPQNFRARNNFAAFLYEMYGPGTKARPHLELLKAEALSRHPLVQSNMEKLSQRSKYD